MQAVCGTTSVPGISYPVFALAISPDYASDDTLFAGLVYGGVMVSPSGGDFWYGISSGLPAELYVKALAISPNYASDGTLYAGSDRDGVFRSTNGGASWQACNNGITQLHATGLAISPDYAHDHTVFYVGSGEGNIFKSADACIPGTLSVGASLT